MNTNRNIKGTHARNVTPNFLPFKRMLADTQASPPSKTTRKKKFRAFILKMLSAVLPRRAGAASTSMKNESYTLAN